MIHPLQPRKFIWGVYLRKIVGSANAITLQSPDVRYMYPNEAGAVPAGGSLNSIPVARALVRFQAQDAGGQDALGNWRATLQTTVAGLEGSGSEYVESEDVTAKWLSGRGTFVAGTSRSGQVVRFGLVLTNESSAGRTLACRTEVYGQVERGQA